MSREVANVPLSAVLILVICCFAAPCLGQWSPAKGPLMTRWAKDVTPENVHAEYPRPQMVREQWLNLNGLWDYAITDKDAERPVDWDGKILVPFPIESALSGVMKRVGVEQRLWYRRTFTIPERWGVAADAKSKRVLLHFGAVDWEATVWVNGERLGEHRGGYDPFSFDITAALRTEGEQEIVVVVHDPTDAARQPRGKQVREPEGIWYTPTTGIWQTVWIEPVPQPKGKFVPQNYIESIRVDATTHTVNARVTIAGTGDESGVLVRVFEGEREIESAGGFADQPIHIPVPGNRREWSPEQPFLYTLRIELVPEFWQTDDRPVYDQVISYVALRKVNLVKDAHGVTRIALNDKPLFLYGPLDQGFWPDGLYTAPTDEALRYDIEVMKRLGFNAVRKHVKIEPARWYYWCDKLGLLVLQDVPSAAPFVAPGKGEIEREPEWAEQFEAELKAMIDARRNHPSIVMWVPFNEGWGQYDTVRIAKWIKEYDPTRLVDCASGWNDYPAGDVHDIHAYPGPASPKPEEKRAAMLGEFGGLGLPTERHTWQEKKNWGYRSYDSREALADAYEQLVAQLHPMIGSPGLSAAIYTQLTDVEIEVNGLLTYDREIIKIDPQRLAAANRKLYGPPPEIRVVAPTSRDEPQSWHYATEAPPGDAWRESKDDPPWKVGQGGFGREGTPGAVVRTPWHTSDIWLRRVVRIDGEPPTNPHLLMHHDEDAEVYINGVLAIKVTGYTTDYVLFPLPPEARTALKPGDNLLAVHCRQTAGGQYIDVGIVYGPRTHSGVGGGEPQGSP